MKNLLLLVGLLSFQTGKSQNLDWAASFGGLSAEQALAVVSDPNDQSIYITGWFFSEFDGIPGATNSNSVAIDAMDLFLIKLDAQGNFVWMNLIGGIGNESGMDIVLDNNHNVILLTKEFPATSVYKYDQNGGFIWFYSSDYASSTSPESVDIDSEGNVYVCGTYSDTVDFDNSIVEDLLIAEGNEDGFLLKLNSDGEYAWAKSIGGSSGGAVGQELKVTSEDDLIFSGFFYGTVDFDPGIGSVNETAFGSTDIFTSKLDSSGNHIWTLQTGGTGSNQVTGLVLDVDDNIYSTGHFEGSLDADPSGNAEFLNSNGNFDFYVQKLDVDGNFVWAQSFGGMQYDIAEGIALDNTGELYVTGNFGAAMDFDPGTAIVSLDAGVGDDTFILKLTNGGDFIWVRQIESQEAMNTGFDINVDLNNNILVVGTYMGQTDFDPNSATFEMTSIESLDAFLLKLNQDQSGLTKNDEQVIRVYPNPSLGTIQLEGQFEQTATIYGLDGKFIESVEVSQGQIDLEHLKKGAYFLVVETAPSRFMSKKIILE